VGAHSENRVFREELFVSRWALASLLVFVVAVSVPAWGADEEEYRRDDAPKNSFSASFEYESFRGSSTEPWELAVVEYSHKFQGFGSVVFRVNRADRFDREGFQYEIDAYPKLAPGLYMYLNAGVSSDSLFPDQRYGAQIYKSLGNGWEASLGFRYLKFNDSTVIYTGSIGRYWGNYYLTFTPYVVPDEIDGASASGALELRYYRTSGDDYWAFRGGYGNAPDVDTLLQITNRLDNGGISVSRQRPLSKKWKTTFLKAKAGYSEREYNVNVKRDSFVVEVGIKHRF
jgi:YaiO family outer membrane protein